MSFAVRNFYPTHNAFRLSPLVMALALISPFHANAAEQSEKIERSEQIATQTHHFHRDHILGTSLDVVVQGASKQEAKRAVDAIQQEISQLDQVLSTWRDDSEISALNNNKQGNVSAELFEVIAACENWRDKTCGAFDARLGQLVTLWEQSQGINEATRTQVLNQLKADSVKLDREQQSIAMDSAVKFSPDAYAKGYIIDRALVAARQAVPGIQGLLVDIGGDIRVWGNAPQKEGWKIGVQDAFNHTDNSVPQQVLNLNDQAIAFSGKGYRSLAGQTHLLDPKTGMPLQQVEQCVVVGTCAADADALATALAAMTPAEGLELIEALSGYEVKVTLTDGQVYQSSGWNSLVQTPQHAEMRTVAASQSSAKWPVGYQAIIDLIIPKIAVENYRAPYVSVWVTDANKKIVRTLAVWGKDEKWINSNYVWYRRYGRQMPNLDAVAKPSRQPGQYKLSWDGKDETGKAVAAGKYLIHIETSREHGEHSYQTFDLDVKATASNQTLAAQKEIGAVKLNFQKVN
jgi:FAD:protein FMN transferase